MYIYQYKNVLTGVLQDHSKDTESQGWDFRLLKKLQQSSHPCAPEKSSCPRLDPAFARFPGFEGEVKHRLSPLMTKLLLPRDPVWRSKGSRPEEPEGCSSAHCLQSSQSLGRGREFSPRLACPPGVLEWAPIQERTAVLSGGIRGSLVKHGLAAMSFPPAALRDQRASLRELTENSVDY